MATPAPTPQSVTPLYVIGRQHSGNTILTTLLGRLPGMLALTAEGTFFECRRTLDRLPPGDRASRTARNIRDDGARRLIRSSSFAEEEKELWREATRGMTAAAERGATAAELYVLGMSRVIDLFGASRWVQKGTSYVFVADDILKTFPQARLIFITRNPLDLAASTKRRNGTGRHTLRVALGWRRGVQRALDLSASAPDRVRLVRYEDLVSDPASTIQKICAFGGLTYDPVCLDVPHVNKSDSPYNTESEQSGLNASRVHYYDSLLTKGEQAAIQVAVGRSAMSRLYPRLTGDPAELSGAVMSVLARGAVSIAGEEARRFAQAPVHVLRRISKRL